MRSDVSPVDDGHVPLVVPLAGGRREAIEPLDLLGAQLADVKVEIDVDHGLTDIVAGDAAVSARGAVTRKTDR